MSNAYLIKEGAPNICPFCPCGEDKMMSGGPVDCDYSVVCASCGAAGPVCISKESAIWAWCGGLK